MEFPAVLKVFLNCEVECSVLRWIWPQALCGLFFGPFPSKLSRWRSTVNFMMGDGMLGDKFTVGGLCLEGLGF